jgi:hypothetical protein
MGNEEIIGVATKFVKANCYSPNPKSYIVKVSWKLGSLTNIYERWKFLCVTLCMSGQEIQQWHPAYLLSHSVHRPLG